MSSRRLLWILGLLSALVYALNFDAAAILVTAGLLRSHPAAIVSYLAQLVPLSLFYLVAVKLVLRDRGKGLMSGVLLFAFFFRLPLIFQEPLLSSDMYRYLWEGRVQVAGAFSPYLYPPEDQALVPLRDQEIYPHVNRKPSPTIYPAGAQLLFRLVYQAGIDNPVKLKALALIADATTVGLLLLLLQKFGRPWSHVLIYAWNPLVIYEIFHSGHLEAFVLPPLAGFVWFALRGRLLAAGGMLGLSAAIKLVPALFLLAIPPAKLPRLLFPFFLILALAYLPYLEAGKRAAGFLPVYFSDPYEIFNPGLLQIALFRAAEALSLSLLWVRYALLSLLGAFLLWLLRKPTEAHPLALVEKSCAVFGAYLLLIYPAFHPWYLLPLIPFLCLIPSPAWIYLSLALPLSYLKYLAPGGHMPGWVAWTQFAPLYLLLALEFARVTPLDEWRHQWQPGSRRASSPTL